MGSLPLTSEPFDWVPDAKPTLRLDANEQIGLRALTLTTGGQWKTAVTGCHMHRAQRRQFLFALTLENHTAKHT